MMSDVSYVSGLRACTISLVALFPARKAVLYCRVRLSPARDRWYVVHTEYAEAVKP